MLLQKNQLFLRFLQLRAVVDGQSIYALVRNKPIVIDLPATPARLVVTDGFHITEAVELRHGTGSPFFKIVCAIEDEQLIAGLAIMAAMYVVGATSDLAWLQLLSMGPVFYFLFIYYFRRRVFIRICPA